MNRQTSEAIAEIHDRIGNQQLRLRTLRDNCQNAFDTLPEEVHGSSKGMELQDGILAMTEALDALDMAMDSLKGI